MRIRPVARGDRDEWLRMRCALWPEERQDHAAEVDAWLDDPASSHSPMVEVFVAERDAGGLCGFAEAGLRDFADVSEDRPAAYLEGIFVDADMRRQGVAGALLETVETWARARGSNELASDFVVDNGESRAWHQALGFREVETLVLVKKRL
jgi:aminoglycoside 6'-N-acetyltransferase I